MQIPFSDGRKFLLAYHMHNEQTQFDALSTFGHNEQLANSICFFFGLA